MSSSSDFNLQCWKYDLGHGWSAWAGKTAEDNDFLSLRVAHPEEYWFHILGQPGSHVILRRPEHEPDAKPDKNLLLQAAAIAAWHSPSRSGGTCSVSCAQAKAVSKPKGAKPGSVTVKKERVLRVRPALPTAEPE